MSATNESAPAQIRNTAVGLESYASLASSDADTTLSRNVMTCASDPCGTAGEVGGGFGCIDGNLGVYCPCFVATVTGEEVSSGEKRKEKNSLGWWAMSCFNLTCG